MPTERACQVIRTLDVIGEKWSLLIVRNALRGQTRYSQFRESLGAPTDILTNRLGKLVDAGVLEKRAYREEGDRERSSYHLTAKGEALRVVIAAMVQWSDEFDSAPQGPSLRLIDGGGQAVSLGYVDASGAVIGRDEVLMASGPGASTVWGPIGVSAGA